MIHVLLRTSPSRSARPLAKRLCSFFRRLTCDFPFAHLSPPVNFFVPNFLPSASTQVH